MNYSMGESVSMIVPHPSVAAVGAAASPVDPSCQIITLSPVAVTYLAEVTAVVSAAKVLVKSVLTLSRTLSSKAPVRAGNIPDPSAFKYLRALVWRVRDGRLPVVNTPTISPVAVADAAGRVRENGLPV